MIWESAEEEVTTDVSVLNGVTYDHTNTTITAHIPMPDENPGHWGIEIKNVGGDVIRRNDTAQAGPIEVDEVRNAAITGLNSGQTYLVNAYVDTGGRADV